MANIKWTLEKLQQEALKYKSRGEFYKKSVNAYSTARRRSVLDQICQYMKYELYPWTFEELQKEALKYKSKSEFEKNNNKAYSTSLSRGILDQICLHMPKRKAVDSKWTLEKLQTEALKYNTRGEFSENSPSPYGIARNRKLLDTICTHMKLVVHHWTNEELQEKALEYKTRKDFENGNTKAYRAAYKRKILDNICQHMKRSINISHSEQNIFDIIKLIYPKTQTLKMRSKKSEVFLENKPHIKGLDIDIYIPELRKGIELDGKYWHSVDGLKRSRKYWPEEDLVNYHKIKDEYFLSKNIKVLHIKEEDWIKNKQKCIDQCLNFLSQGNKNEL